MPSFRLLTVFYAFALICAGMATFGPIGLFMAAFLLGIWAWAFNRKREPSEVIGWFVVLSLVGLLSWMMISALSSVRGTAQRSDCSDNLKLIQLACLVYESTNRTMPPAYAADSNGKPMHSWRVLLLPHFGDPALSALYAKYNLNEPWDGPNNSKLASQIPKVYQCPSHPKSAASPSTDCHYFAAVDPASAWPGAVGRRIAQIADGTSKTIAVVEASGLGINWMEPRDLSMDEAVKLLTTQGRSGHSHVHEGFLTRTYTETSARNVAYCDGAVQWLEQIRDPEVAESMLTAAGRDDIPNDWKSIFAPTKTTIEIKWGAVWGLAVFVALALAPIAWLRRRNQIVEASAAPTAAVLRTAGTGDA